MFHKTVAEVLEIIINWLQNMIKYEKYSIKFWIKCISTLSDEWWYLWWMINSMHSDRIMNNKKCLIQEASKTSYNFYCKTIFPRSSLTIRPSLQYVFIFLGLVIICFNDIIVIVIRFYVHVFLLLTIYGWFFSGNTITVRVDSFL